MKTWEELKSDLLDVEDAVVKLLRATVDDEGDVFESEAYLELNRRADRIGHAMDAMNKKYQDKK